MNVRQRISTAILAAFITTLASAAEPEARSHSSRITPITEAVRNTSASVLSLKVYKRDKRGRSFPTFGSAFVVDERGYAVTNCHVVNGSFRIQAFSPDGSSVNAVLVAEEAAYDLALLKLEVADKKLPAVALGASSDLILGETVLAVGNALGYSHTVSRGIISAVGRQMSLPGLSKLGETGVIQTDAPINPGNSGGPLINMDGEVIGVNFAHHDGAQGIAFAIPIHLVKELLCRHLSARKVRGVEHGLVLVEQVTHEGKTGRQQVLVTRVVPDSPAARAGLETGDHLVALAGRHIVHCFDVERALWDSKTGDNITARIDRAGKSIELRLTLAATITTVVNGSR